MWLGSALFGFEINHYMSLGSIALTPLFLPGLLANDMHRASPLRVVGGVALGASFVIPLTLAFEMATAGVFPHLWVMIATLSGSLIFRDQIAWVTHRVIGGVVVAIRGRGGRHSISVDDLLSDTSTIGDFRRLDQVVLRSEPAAAEPEKVGVMADG